MVLDQLKSQIRKWRDSSSREQRIIPEEISLKGTSASLSADEGKNRNLNPGAPIEKSYF